ncbi:hypothetical protein PENSPDRAFT_653282 [Peniophora sp. CONT]|nr:hypothetical protein PENSPDRAFT_653282 [Peniophora sp. CONT]
MVTDAKLDYTAPPPGDPPGYDAPAYDDAPPSHDAPGYSAGPSSSSSYSSFVPAPNIPACNHLLQSEKDTTLKGQYLLDVGLPASAAAASLPSFKDLKDANLRFEVRDGAIRPEIWLAALKEKAPPTTRARVAAKIRDGSIHIVMHAPHPSMPRPRISLKVEQRDGDMWVAIPRSFEGTLKITRRNGGFKLSEGISRSRLLYSANGMSLYSLGEQVEEALTDEVVIEKRDGSLMVMYDDEPRK